MLVRFRWFTDSLPEVGAGLLTRLRIALEDFPYENATYATV